MSQEPEYLPMPDGYAQRVADLAATGLDSVTAHWMAACEATGAVGRRESNHHDLFWFGEPTDGQREVWDRIADREGKRFYFHQKLDTLVGYLSYGRHSARQNADLAAARGERLVAFIKAHGLWDAWVDQNRNAPKPAPDPS